MSRSLPVLDNCIIRKGYKPFTHSVGQILAAEALDNPAAAFLRDDLEAIRRARKGRNR